MIIGSSARHSPVFSTNIPGRCFNPAGASLRPKILSKTSHMGSNIATNVFSPDKRETVSGCHERPLNGLERFFYEIAKNADNDTISGYRVQLKSSLPSLDIMQKSISDLYQNMPALNTNIIESNADVPCVSFRDSQKNTQLSYKEIAVDSLDAWKTILSSGLGDPFDAATDPLVQFIGLRNTNGGQDQLLTITHHSLMDGEGMLHVYQALFELMKENEAPSLVGTEAVGMPASVATPVEFDPAVCESYIENYSFKKPTLAFLTMSLMVDFIAKKVMPLFESQELQPGTSISDLALTPADTRQLLKAAKENGVSVYGAIAAAAIRTVGVFFPRHIGGQLVTTFSPVSLRSRLETEVDPDDLGCYTSLVRDTFYQTPKALSSAQEPAASKEDRDAFWALAKRAHGQIREAVESGEHEAIPYIFDEFFKTKSDPTWLAKAVVPDTLILNNLGRKSLHSHEQTEVDSFSWVTSFGTLAPGVSVNFLTMNDKLQVALFSRRLDEKTLQDFAAHFEAELRSVMTV